MKRSLVHAAWALLLGLGLGFLAACGGSSGTLSTTPVATITSFTALPLTITAGGSTSLTGIFANGTGVITPGNLSVTSQTPVSVSPTTTTTYTLTVTPTSGSAAIETVTVTVNPPPPSISSFTANPATITVGANSSLTADFANGIGVITPGNLPVTSGAPVTVTPTATQIYTLTVTGSTGSPATQTVTVTVNPALPTISSFTANPASVGESGSTSLTAVFANGTGVIMPGTISVTSGTPISVSPTATTTYTLTVTPTTGAPITQTLTVTYTGPSITSFVASPAVLVGSGSSSLTAVFANGDGVITPGPISVISGTPVSVSPKATTIYTLTVTPTTGAPIVQKVTVTLASAGVTVNQTSTGPAVTDQILGMNMAAWYDVKTNATAVVEAFQTAGIKAVRWPGGSWSDAYHWSTNTNCQLARTGQDDPGDPNSDDTFSNFVSNIANPAGLDVALTANYGSDAACTGGGDPTEAAAWVAAAITDGVTVSHMTVGNEEYGSWEIDQHTLQNNPTTYSTAVAGATGYYQLIKAASPATLVGVDVNPGNSPAWDPTVLKNAPYDFVEYHYYPETPGQESDTFLVNSAPQNLTTSINTIKSELTTAGKTGTPIYVGEIGGPYSNPGKQSWSITQGLYAGQVLGEMMNDGVSRLTWWIGFGGCEDSASGSGANFSASLYGWQDFGGYMVFSDGLPEYDCENETLPIGTLSPTARAFQLFSNVAVSGESVLTANVTGDTTDVVAYAATHSGGTALVLFNRNETSSQPVLITLSAQTSASTVTVITYDKATYDLSGSTTGTPPDPAGTSTWAGPTTANLGAQALPLTLTLTPWSMNVVIIH